VRFNTVSRELSHLPATPCDDASHRDNNEYDNRKC
jgi:hypothetical protein